MLVMTLHYLLYIVMYAIWHTRPHSPLPVPSLPPSRRSPHLSLDWPGLLCLCPCCCSICTCLCQVILARAPFEPSDTIVIHLLDATQVTSIDSSLKYGCWTWPLQFSCYWRLILQRDSFWRAVGRCTTLYYDIGGRLTPGETVVLSRRRWARRIPRVPAAIRVCWTIRDIGTVSVLSNKLFIVVLAAVIIVVVVGSVVLPSLNAPLLVFALLACNFPFPLVLFGVADPLDIP